MWGDSAAILGLLREDNVNAQLCKGETELDAFGHVVRLISSLAASCPEGRVIKTADVMAIIAEQGFGTMPLNDWEYLVTFRLSLPSQYAEMLLDCLSLVCNGLVSIPAKTYAEIHSLHPNGHPWVKIFLLMETYCADCLSEERGQHKAIGHTGPKKRTKTLDVKAIRLLAKEKDLLTCCDPAENPVRVAEHVRHVWCTDISLDSLVFPD